MCKRFASHIVQRAWLYTAIKPNQRATSRASRFHFLLLRQSCICEKQSPWTDVAPDCLKRSLPFGPRVAVKWKRKCNERF
jgi:hypothetical protein